MTLAGRLFAALALVVTASCSIVSGWSDLQGGASPSDSGATNSPPASDDAGLDGNDASLPPAIDSGGAPSTGPDAALADGSFVPIDAASVVMTVACGSTRCAIGQGCCFAILGGGTCETSAGSCSPASAFATCSDSLQCEALLEHPAQCCQSGTGQETIGCRTSCDGVGPIVCDPTFATPGCPAGTTCKPVTGFGYYVCK